jgi:hypothetical protein
MIINVVGLGNFLKSLKGVYFIWHVVGIFIYTIGLFLVAVGQDLLDFFFHQLQLSEHKLN